MRRGKCISLVNLEVFGAFTSGLLVVCCVFLPAILRFECRPGFVLFGVDNVFGEEVQAK